LLFIPVQLRKNALAQRAAQCARRRDVERDSDQPFQLQLDRREIEQAGAFGGVDQQVQVAAVGILPPGDRPEHSRIAGAMSLDDAPNGCAMGLERA
jgi:hypothetical protein